jgi:hypothetical protein
MNKKIYFFLFNIYLITNLVNIKSSQPTFEKEEETRVNDLFQQYFYYGDKETSEKINRVLKEKKIDYKFKTITANNFHEEQYSFLKILLKKPSSHHNVNQWVVERAWFINRLASIWNANLLIKKNIT